MVMAPQVPKVIGVSEVLEAMAHCTEVAVVVAVTMAVAAVALTLTHAAPTPEAAVVDLHTPTQV
jgi:L-alanine-DL-glutamate epimerase-like enolase superfamily enzyme